MNHRVGRQPNDLFLKEHRFDFAGLVEQQISGQGKDPLGAEAPEVLGGEFQFENVAHLNLIPQRLIGAGFGRPGHVGNQLIGFDISGR